MLNKNVETFFGCDNEYATSRIVVFGAPFDSTTSFRPGTRFASKTMRSESFGLENYSLYQDRDVSDVPFFDAGDLELCLGDAERALRQIEDFADGIYADGKLPLMIGGEHLVTLGAVRAIASRCPDLHIIHFDAHADLREDYLGARLSHAAVVRRRHEQVGDDRIFQFGIRSGDREEMEWGRGHVVTHRFDFEGLSETIASLEGKPIYFTLDLDVLDPAVFPGTGTPEAGGVTFPQLLDAMREVTKRRIVGCDINELCPVYDQSGASTALACKVLRELLLLLSPE